MLSQFAFLLDISSVALESEEYNTQKGGLNVSGEKSIQVFDATHYIEEKYRREVQQDVPNIVVLKTVIVTRQKSHDCTPK